MLPPRLGLRKRKLNNHTSPYADTLVKTESKSNEASVRPKDYFAGFVARMGKERLPRRLLFGGMVQSTGRSAGQEKDWNGRIDEGLSSSASCLKDGARQHRMPADGVGGSTT